MPAISFQREFLGALLRGDKRQTTRKQTDRIKVGDICNICIDPHNRIGKVKIIEVYDVLPIRCIYLSAWAEQDGFDNFTAANTWFTRQYGSDWMEREWTVVRWNGWVERYFEPEP